MPRNPSNQSPRPAQVEDFDTDKGKVVPGTAKSANAAPRRAPQAPPVTKATKVTRTGGPDTASESGSSSRTAATMNSSDSARELRGEPAKKETKQKKKVVVQEQPQPEPTETRRTRRDSARQQPSPTKAPARTASQRRKSRHVQCTGCDDPNCPDAIKPDDIKPSSRRSALDTGVDIDYPPFNVQPTPQARARSSSRPRTQSVYEPYYSSRSGPGPRGPPPSNSAYINYRQSYYPGSTAQSASYLPSATSTVRSSAVHTRPPLQTSNTDPTYSARRPSSGIFEPQPPVISYGPSGPSARYADPYASQNPRDSGIVYYDDNAEAAVHRLSSSGFPARRSSLRHSYNLPAPTPANEFAVEEDYVDDDYADDYAEDYRLSRPTSLQRTTSQRRSSLAPPPSFARAQPSYPDTPDQERAAAAEYYQQQTNRRARPRAADAYPHPHDNPPRAAAPQPVTSRPDPPRRRTSSRAPSERSARTGVSGSSRVSTQADGSIRVRVDASRGIEFSGNMEGRSINVTGADNGMADVIISTGNGRGETVYGGSRASGG
ncbi:MAG: hypothetical protein Q9157_007275, partial [Trypethelium eluteriae]